MWNAARRIMAMLSCFLCKDQGLIDCQFPSSSSRFLSRLPICCSLLQHGWRSDFIHFDLREKRVASQALVLVNQLGLMSMQTAIDCGDLHHLIYFNLLIHPFSLQIVADLENNFLVINGMFLQIHDTSNLMEWLDIFKARMDGSLDMEPSPYFIGHLYQYIPQTPQLNTGTRSKRCLDCSGKCHRSLECFWRYISESIHEMWRFHWSVLQAAPSFRSKAAATALGKKIKET